MAVGLTLAIRLRFHNPPPEQLTQDLAFHQRQPISSDATSSAGQKKNDGGWAGSSWMGVLAMGVAWEMGLP